jgi:hypothetical protein
MERAAFAGLAGGGIIIAAGGQRLGVDTSPTDKLEPERLHRRRGSTGPSRRRAAAAARSSHAASLSSQRPRCLEPCLQLYKVQQLRAAARGQMATPTEITVVLYQG